MIKQQHNALLADQADKWPPTLKQQHNALLADQRLHWLTLLGRVPSNVVRTASEAIN